MKLETGKFYKTSDGRKVGPMIREDWNDGEPWTAEDVNRYYTDEGSRTIPTGEPDDLISEWSDLTPHQQRTAEMIKVMQAYVDGEEIEIRQEGTDNWWIIDNPEFYPRSEYRIAPSTTPDTIDWSHVAPEFKWMARDEKGIVSFHKSKPILLSEYLGWSDLTFELKNYINMFASYRRGTCDWKDSLVKRPE